MQKSELLLKSHGIYDATVANLVQNQQVLVACHQILGMCLYGQCQQVVVSLVPAKFDLLCGLKTLTDNLHELYERVDFLLGEILSKLRTRGYVTYFSKQLVANNQLDSFITQQVAKAFCLSES